MKPSQQSALLIGNKIPVVLECMCYAGHMGRTVEMIGKEAWFTC